jgi:hypothetical protein
MMGLPEDVPADSIVLDEDNVEHANDIKKRDANRCGYSDLISLIDTTKSSGRAAFSVVRMAKNETSPMGSLPLAWARLKNKYSPKSAPRLGRLQGMFYSSKLKPGNDPVNFVDYMESVRTEMDEIHQDTDGVVIGAMLMSDRQFVQAILNAALTDDYANLIEKVEDKIDEGTPLGIEDLKEKLAAKYTRIKVWSKQENRNELHEHALYGTDSTPSYYTDGFSGLCRNCGKRGHKSVNCRDKNNGNGNKVGNFGPPRFKVECYNCGKIGHRKMECRAPKQQTNGPTLLSTDATTGVVNKIKMTWS